jgi:hypothetical protein
VEYHDIDRRQCEVGLFGVVTTVLNLLSSESNRGTDAQQTKENNLPVRVLTKICMVEVLFLTTGNII